MKKKLLELLFTLDFIYRIPKFYLDMKFNKIVKSQISATEKIPVIIINYNQLYFLKKNVDRLLQLGFINVIIIDNKSDYPDLIEYYETENRVTIFKMQENLGHMVLYNNKAKQIFNEYCKGFYFLTDADIILNENMPMNFRSIMINELKAKHRFITKVGVALDISNIPDYYALKQKVLKWERKFWANEYKKNFYFAEIDTTFALYKPGFKPGRFTGFAKGIRLGGPYTAMHGGWYLGKGILEKEREYYFKSNLSTSWIFDENGKIVLTDTNRTY